MHYVMRVGLITFHCVSTTPDDSLRLQVVTVATRATDGYERFMRSVDLFNLDVQVSLEGVVQVSICVVSKVIKLFSNRVAVKVAT